MKNQDSVAIAKAKVASNPKLYDCCRVQENLFVIENTEKVLMLRCGNCKRRHFVARVTEKPAFEPGAVPIG